MADTSSKDSVRGYRLFGKTSWNGTSPQQMVMVRIAWRGGEVTANLRDTPTAKQLATVLPCEASANTWGDEVYFEVPLEALLESDAQQVVEPGTVCFWVQGSSLALPFGPTPVSKGDECRLVTRCNVLGKIEGDPRQLEKVKQGVTIRVELLEIDDE